mgnify:CR=1 FL=1
MIPYCVRLIRKPLLSINYLINGRRKSVLESHDFENLREDIWAGVVDTDTCVRYLFYDPPPADSDPIQPSVARSEHHLE